MIGLKLSSQISKFGILDPPDFIAVPWSADITKSYFYPGDSELGKCLRMDNESIAMLVEWYLALGPWTCPLFYMV